MIDHHGIMRKPSGTGLQALAVYSMLKDISDQREGAAQSAMEGEIHNRVGARLDMDPIPDTYEQREYCIRQWSSKCRCLVYYGIRASRLLLTMTRYL